MSSQRKFNSISPCSKIKTNDDSQVRYLKQKIYDFYKQIDYLNTKISYLQAEDLRESKVSNIESEVHEKIDSIASKFQSIRDNFKEFINYSLTPLELEYSQITDKIYHTSKPLEFNIKNKREVFVHKSTDLLKSSQKINPRYGSEQKIKIDSVRNTQSSKNYNSDINFDQGKSYLYDQLPIINSDTKKKQILISKMVFLKSQIQELKFQNQKCRNDILRQQEQFKAFSSTFIGRNINFTKIQKQYKNKPKLDQSFQSYSSQEKDETYYSKENMQVITKINSELQLKLSKNCIQYDKSLQELRNHCKTETSLNHKEIRQLKEQNLSTFIISEMQEELNLLKNRSPLKVRTDQQKDYSFNLEMYSKSQDLSAVKHIFHDKHDILIMDSLDQDQIQSNRQEENFVMIEKSHAETQTDEISPGQKILALLSLNVKLKTLQNKVKSLQEKNNHMKNLLKVQNMKIIHYKMVAPQIKQKLCIFSLDLLNIKNHMETLFQYSVQDIIQGGIQKFTSCFMEEFHKVQLENLKLLNEIEMVNSRLEFVRENNKIYDLKRKMKSFFTIFISKSQKNFKFFINKVKIQRSIETLTMLNRTFCRLKNIVHFKQQEFIHSAFLTLRLCTKNEKYKYVMEKTLNHCLKNDSIKLQTQKIEIDQDRVREKLYFGLKQVEENGEPQTIINKLNYSQLQILKQFIKSHENQIYFYLKIIQKIQVVHQVRIQKDPLLKQIIKMLQNAEKNKYSWENQIQEFNKFSTFFFENQSNLFQVDNFIDVILGQIQDILNQHHALFDLQIN